MAEQEVLHVPARAGPVPPGWSWRRLDAVCLGIYDCPHSTPAITGAGPLMARTQDVRGGIFRVDQAAHVSEETYQDRIARVEPRVGDLLYSREGTYFGDAAEVPPGVRVCLGQRMVLIRPDPAVMVTRFLRFWLNSPILRAHIEGHRDGSVAERLNLPTIRGLPVLVPPLAVQRPLAEVLGVFDDKIELNRRMNETLEAMSLALFKSWFVDFDPVRAKIERRVPTGMDAEAAALFPDRFEPSEIGAVPGGWKVASLPDIIEVNPPRSLKKGDVAPYLDMANMPTAGHLAMEWESRPHGSGARFTNGDTLLARITPCLENGKTAFVDFMEPGQIGWGSTEYIVLRPKPPLPAFFGYLLARSEGLRAHAIQSMTGTTGRQRVPASALDHYRLAVPPQAVAAAFDRATAPLIELTQSNDQESRTLRELRDLLLPKLLSGELRVWDAARIVDRAV